jgi:hypothetical protein
MTTNASPRVLGKGFEAAMAAYEKEAAERPAMSGTWRFLLKRGEQSKVVFLENEPAVTVEEHFVRVGPEGRPRNIVCPGDNCPLCLSGNKKSTVSYFTVLRLEETTTRNGTKLVNPVRILGAKSITMDYLIRQFEKRGGLQGAVFEVARSSKQQSPGVGDLWDFEQKITKDQIKELNPEAKPVNFMEELDFLSVDEIADLLNGTAAAAAKDEEPVTETETPEYKDVEW